MQIKFASLSVQVKGFSQNTCLLFCIANFVILLCKVGGVAIITALIFLSNINFFQSEYILISLGIFIFLFFFDLKQKPVILYF